VILYKNVISQILKLYTPVNGIMAHSLGGLATALVLEETNDTSIKAVLIAPLTESTTAIKNFFKFVRVDDAVRTAFDKLLFQLAFKPAEWFSANRIVAVINNKILWLHDEEDTVCPYKDSLPTRNNKPLNVEFVTTSGLGHNKIYRDEDVQKKVIDFLNA
jgi:pimeloyl-ACP methyl ester carboxylesterase